LPLRYPVYAALTLPALRLAAYIHHPPSLYAHLPLPHQFAYLTYPTAWFCVLPAGTTRTYSSAVGPHRLRLHRALVNTYRHFRRENTTGRHLTALPAVPPFTLQPLSHTLPVQFHCRRLARCVCNALPVTTTPTCHLPLVARQRSTCRMDAGPKGGCCNVRHYRPPRGCFSISCTARLRPEFLPLADCRDTGSLFSVALLLHAGLLLHFATCCADLFYLPSRYHYLFCYTVCDTFAFYRLSPLHFVYAALNAHHTIAAFIHHITPTIYYHVTPTTPRFPALPLPFLH